MDKYQFAKHLVAMTTLKNVNGMMSDVLPAVMPEPGEEMDKELWDAYMKATTAVRDLWTLVGKRG